MFGELLSYTRPFWNTTWTAEGGFMRKSHPLQAQIITALTHTEADLTCSQNLYH